MKKFSLKLMMLAASMFAFVSINAQNSTCATAAPLTIGGTACSGTTGGANSGDPTGFDDTDGNVASSNYSGGDDFIFEYTATTTDALQLDLTSTNAWSGIMVTAGCPTSGTAFGFSGSSATVESVTTDPMTIGETYYIHISTWPSPQSPGQFCLDASLITPPPPPPGSSCAMAIDLDTETSPYSGSTATPGLSHPYTTCGGTAPQMVHSITVPDGFTLDIQVTTDSYDTRHSLYNGCPDVGTQILCVDDPDNQAESYTNTSGSTQTLYWIQGAFSSATGTYELAWTLTAPPACAEPSAITFSPLTLTTATINYTSAAAGMTEFYIAPTGDPITTGFYANPSVAGVNSVLLDTETTTGFPLLTPGASYDVWVREDCGVDGLSALVGPLTFTLLSPGDECGVALPIACGDLAVGNTSGNGASTIGAFTGSNELAPDEWFTFTGVNSGDLAALAGTPGDAITLSTCNDGGATSGNSGYDTKIDVYSGACGALTHVGGNDDGGGCANFSSLFNFPTTVGTVYYVRIYGFNGGSSGAYELSMECSAPCLPVPANDDCASSDALTLTAYASPSPVSGTTDCASAETFNPSCDSFGEILGVWYEFTTDATGGAVLSLEAGTSSGLNYVLYDVAPCDGTASELLCVDNFDTSVEATLPTAANTTYKLMVYSNTLNSGDFDVAVTLPPPPPANDDCAGAIAITSTVWGQPGWTSHSSETATESLSGCTGNADDDVWFSFVANSPNDVVLARGFDGVVEIYEGGCAGTAIACEDSEVGNPERAHTGTLVPGDTYHFRVYQWGVGGGDFEVAVKTFEDGMVNGDFCGATDHTLDESIYAERDDLGQLYANPGVPVLGYEFRFQEVGGGLDVIASHPSMSPFISLASVPGLEYGKSYDVSVRHLVRFQANGTVLEEWSDFGTSCVIGLGAAPVTQLRTEFCGATDLTLSNTLLADVIAGADQYRFTFTGGGSTFTKLSNNYAVQLYTVGGGGLLYNTAYDVTVEARVSGTWTSAGMVCTIGMIAAPGAINVQETYCGGTYDFPAPNFILADQVLGATEYTFRFTPVGGGMIQEEVRPGLSLPFHVTSLSLTSGQYDVAVKVEVGGVYGDYSMDPCVITINNTMPQIENEEESAIVAASKFIELPAGFSANIFPNPNTGEEVTIALEGLDGDAAMALVRFIDVTGKVVFSESLPVKGEQAQFVLNPAGLSAGIYSMNIQVGSQFVTESFVVK